MVTLTYRCVIDKVRSFYGFLCQLFFFFYLEKHSDKQFPILFKYIVAYLHKL